MGEGDWLAFPGCPQDNDNDVTMERAGMEAQEDRASPGKEQRAERGRRRGYIGGTLERIQLWRELAFPVLTASQALL